MYEEALQAASQDMDIYAVTALLEAGADPKNLINKFALYALIAKTRGEDLVNRLFTIASKDLNATEDDMSTDGKGPNVLQHAVTACNLSLVNLFIAAGADVEGADDRYTSPLLMAASASNPAAVRNLLNANANTDLFPITYNIPFFGIRDPSVVPMLIEYHVDNGLPDFQ